MALKDHGELMVEELVVEEYGETALKDHKELMAVLRERDSDMTTRRFL